jgi:cyanate permease
MGQRRTPDRSWAVLGCASFLGFGMYARILCVPPIGHIIKADLALSHGQLGLIFSLPIGILAVLAIPGGLLCDRFGIRKTSGIGAIVMALGSLLTGSAGGFASLFVFTCLFGVGFSLVYPNLPKVVSTWFPREKAGIATGIYVIGIGFGAALALTITLPVILPLTHTFRGTFYIWSLPIIGAAVLWWLVVKNPRPSQNGQQGPEERSLWRQGTSLQVLKNRHLWLVVLAFFCLDVHFYTWSGWTPKLMMLKGASPDFAALLTSIIQWVSLPGYFIIPWISYKVGLRRPFIWLPALILALASWGAIHVPVSLGWPLMIVVGITLSGTFPILLSLPVEMVPPESVGTASGLVLSLGYIGGIAGPLVTGYIVDATGTLSIPLLILFGVALIWTVSGFLLPETGTGHES